MRVLQLLQLLQLLLLTSGVPLLKATAGSLTVRRESFLEKDHADTDNRPAAVDSVHAFAINSGGNVKKTVTKVKQEPPPACTTLKNAGSYFTAEIQVGSSSQKFDVVADTGSNAVIVADCRCKTCGFLGAAEVAAAAAAAAAAGAAGAAGRAAASGQGNCYQDNVQVNAQTPGLAMGFGSGKLEAMIATDDVKIGSVTARMTDQLLLMVVKDKDLQKVDFDGILGLGIPEKADPAHDKDWSSGNMSAKVTKTDGSDKGAEYVTKSFLEEAGLTRFSICFQDGATQELSNGYLRIGIPVLGDTALGSVGTMHWGLDFRGVSVGAGKTAADVKFCTQAEMKGATTDEYGVAIPAMTSPCGAIPDSGTTLILGPAAHIATLYEEICDDWSRCSSEFAALPAGTIKAVKDELNAKLQEEEIMQKAIADAIAAAGGTAAAKGNGGGGTAAGADKQMTDAELDAELQAVAMAKVKSTLVEALLAKCSTWLTDDSGLDDLPELNFYLKGSGGKDQTLTFKGSQYIESGEMEDIGQIQQAASGGDGGGIGGSNSGGIGDGGIGGSGIGRSGSGSGSGTTWHASGGDFLEGRKTLAKEPYLDFLKRTGPRHEKKTRVCLAAFDTVDYKTATNGPVWILGTPLFYSFKVSFESTPPSMKFEKDGCAACDATSMMDGPSKQTASKVLPRRIKGKARWPSKPLSGPF